VTTHLHIGLVPKLKMSWVVPTYTLSECLRDVHGDNTNDVTTRLFFVKLTLVMYEGMLISP